MFSLIFVLAAIPADLGGFAFTNSAAKPVVKRVSTENIEHKTTRIEHAKELLGPRFQKSPVHRLSGDFDMRFFIEKRLARSLPRPWRKKAPVIAKAVIRESLAHGMDPLFVMAVIANESGFHPGAVGPLGELGLMQLRLRTARWIASRTGYGKVNKTHLRNPVTNIKLGVRYMAYLRSEFESEARRYVVAYNTGPGAVKTRDLGRLRLHPYRLRVMNRYLALYRQAAGNSASVASQF